MCSVLCLESWSGSSTSSGNDFQEYGNTALEVVGVTGQ